MYHIIHGLQSDSCRTDRVAAVNGWVGGASNRPGPCDERMPGSGCSWSRIRDGEVPFSAWGEGVD